MSSDSDDALAHRAWSPPTFDSFSSSVNVALSIAPCAYALATKFTDSCPNSPPAFDHHSGA